MHHCRILSILTGRRRPGVPVAGVVLAATLAALSASACDKMPLLAPSQSTITLSADASVVQTNGVAEIRATVLELSGTPVQNGTTVTFSTNLGALSPPEARTFNGVATVQFLANGNSGIAEIRAISGGATTGTTANPSLKLNVGGAAVGRLVVAASPSSVPSTGGSTTITATVLDTNGNTLTGVAVGFSTTAGSLSSSIATSNGNGAAQVTLTTNRDAVVTATAGVAGTTTAITGTASVTVNALPTLTLAVTTATPTEDAATVFTLTVGAAAQDTFQSVTIDFGNGTSRNLGAITTGVTTVSNIYRDDGTFTVTVTGVGTSGGTQKATAIVSVSPHAPIAVDITATGTVAGGSTSTSTGPYNSSNPVTFTVVTTATNIDHYDWDFGDTASPATVRTTGKTTSHKYVTPSPLSRTVTVTATATDGNTGNSQIQIVVN